jgi:hypothetical protein
MHSGSDSGSGSLRQKVMVPAVLVKVPVQVPKQCPPHKLSRRGGNMWAGVREAGRGAFFPPRIFKLYNPMSIPCIEQHCVLYIEWTTAVDSIPSNLHTQYLSTSHPPYLNIISRLFLYLYVCLSTYISLYLTFPCRPHVSVASSLSARPMRRLPVAG